MTGRYEHHARVLEEGIKVAKSPDTLDSEDLRILAALRAGADALRTVAELENENHSLRQGRHEAAKKFDSLLYSFYALMLAGALGLVWILLR